MSNQRPPGGVDEPTHDPERERSNAGGSDAPQAWVDPHRTKRYEPRRSIVDRLAGSSSEPDPASPRQPEADPESGPASTLRANTPRRAPVMSAQVPAVRRGRGGLRLALILAAAVLLGLAGGAAAAWFSGWRPKFLMAAQTQPERPAPEPTPAAAPETNPGEAPPPESAPPASPRPTEIARNCYTATNEVKAGGTACGFSLDAAGAVSFQGARIAERLAVGGQPAQRLVLYPFSPSGRYVFLRACETATGGRCEVQRLVDTKESKIFAVKGGADGFTWVAWSPKEQVGLLGYRDGLSETIAVISTSDGKPLNQSAIRVARNRYALLRAGSVRWRDEKAFSVEVKLCPLAKGRVRNAACEKSRVAKYRRRLVRVDR